MKSASLIELFVETLTGTVFEIRVSPFSNILELKSKIQQLEGIPVAQQHIIWNSVELKDEKSLEEYKISDGATLHLVLGMKGGPISIRTAQAEELMLKEMSEYVEANKDSLMDSVASDSLVTLYVYRDGESINVVKVVERSDGSSSPLSSSSSKHSDDLAESIRIQRKKENTTTKEKMSAIRSKMASVYKSNAERQVTEKTTFKRGKTNKSSSSSMPKPSHVQLPPLRGQARSRDVPVKTTSNIRKPTSKSTSKAKADFSNSQGPSKHPQPAEDSKLKSKSNSSDKQYKRNSSQPIAMLSNPARLTTGTKMKELRQRLRSEHETSTAAEKGRMSSDVNSTLRPGLRSSWAEPTSNFVTNTGNSLLDSLNRLNLHDRIPDNMGISRHLHSSFNAKQPLPRIKPGNNYDDIDKELTDDDDDHDVFVSTQKGPHPLDNDSEDDVTKNGAVARAFMFSILNQNFPQYHPEKSMSSTVRNRTNLGQHIGSLNANIPSTSDQTHSNQSADVHATFEKASKSRCALCKKKTGLATSYMCRCGGNFCSSHRYAEAHNCSFDYKDEGRRILEKNNPLVTAPKVPKI